MKLHEIKRVLLGSFLLPMMSVGLLACASETQRRAEDEATCRSVGFEAGTEAFSRCLLDLEIARRHPHLRLHH